MPRISNWVKSRRYKDLWNLRDYKIVAKIEGTAGRRGKWVARIIDDEKGEFSQSHIFARYTEAKNFIVDLMDEIGKQVG